ncbi:MAG: hypothetical protein V1778_04580 [bacterium]
MALFLLAFFFFLALASVIVLYRHFHVDVFREGKPLKIPARLIAILLTAVAVGFSLLAIWILRSASARALDLFFAITFSIGWAVNALFLLPRQIGRTRLLVGVATGVAVFALTWTFSSVLLRNLFFAGSILWIGPVIFRRFHLPFRYFLFGLVAFGVYDAMNVFLLSNAGTVVTNVGRFTGLITFGGNELGIGDFFLGYCIVNGAQQYCSSRTLPWILATWSPLPMLLLRWIVPASSGHAYPYSVFLVPVALILFLSVKRCSRDDLASKVPRPG